MLCAPAHQLTSHHRPTLRRSCWPQWRLSCGPGWTCPLNSVGGRGGEDAEGLLRGGGGAGARQRRGQAGQGDQISQCIFFIED